MKIELKVNTLKAAALSAGTKDIRYYINGVCIDIKNATQMVVIGTNGNYCFIGVENYEGDYIEPQQIIIPSEAIASALKGYDKKLNFITLEKLTDKKYSLGNVMFEPIDGKYPDYARIIPNKENVKAEIGYYNHEYLQVGSKALKAACGEEYPTLNQHGESDAAVMTCKMDNYIFIVMPMRARDRKDQLDSYKGIELPV